MDKLDQYKSSAWRRLLVVSLLMPLVALTLLRVTVSEFRPLSYFPQLFMAAAAFGAAEGLFFNHASPACLRKVMMRLAAALVLVIALRTSGIGQLGLVPDSATYFQSLIFLGWILGQEILTSSILLVSCLLIADCQKHLAAEARSLATDVVPAGARLTGVCAGLFFGVTAFALSSALCLPAWSWIVAIALSAAYLARGSRAVLALGALSTLMAAVLTFLPRPGMPRYEMALSSDIWSPYQHVESRALARGGKTAAIELFANGGFNQLALDLDLPDSEEKALRASDLLVDLSRTSADFYAVPYMICHQPKNVLVLGAGTGNDVASAIAHGAGHVDAVEIDPAIVAVGRAHPQHPYDAPNVSVHVGDARRFLATEKTLYDLILFSRLDSQVTSSPLLPGRGSDYVTTVEGIKAMKARLAPGGKLVFALNFWRSWSLRRLVRNVREVFRIVDGAVILKDGQYVVTTSEHKDDLGPLMARAPGLIASPDTIRVNEEALDADPTTDDWPFLFLQTKAFPLPYLWALYVTAAFLIWRLRGPLADWWQSEPDMIKEAQSVESIALGAGAACFLSWASAMSTLHFGSTIVAQSLPVLLVLLALVLASAWRPYLKRLPAWPFRLSYIVIAASAPFVLPAVSQQTTTSWAFADAAFCVYVFVLALVISVLTVSALGRGNHRAASLALFGAAAAVLLSSFCFLVGVSALVAGSLSFVAIAWLAALISCRKRQASEAGAAS